MTRHEVVEPTLVKEDDHGKTYAHPSYGQIRAGRVSGGRYLYGSDFEHHHYISISISTSMLNRGLSSDWAHPLNEIVTVDMSEAQWATFVSSLNAGSGIQCTIDRQAGVGLVPQAPPPDRKAQFAGEVEESLAEAMTLLAELEARIAAKSTGKETMSLVGRIRNAIGSNTKFVGEQFSRHMEKTVEKAKAEVHGYIQGAITRAGLRHLGADEQQTTLITFRDDEAAGQ